MDLKNTANFFQTIDAMRDEMSNLLQSQQIYAAIIASLVQGSENQELVVKTENAQSAMGMVPVVKQVGDSLRVYIPELEVEEPTDGDS